MPPNLEPPLTATQICERLGITKKVQREVLTIIKEMRA